MKQVQIARIIGLSLTGVIALAIIMGSWFTVQQGSVKVVSTWGKARYVTQPGFHLKRPVMDATATLSIREETNTEEVSAATINRLPVTAKVSATWQIKGGSELEFYKLYGDRRRFEATILDRRMQQSSKAALSKFSAEQLIKDRNTVSQRGLEFLRAELDSYPVTVKSFQVENLVLPPKYMEAVLAKEQAREDAEREQYNLDRQKLVAQQEVQTATAQAEATRLRADAEAYKVKTEGEANADAARKLAEAIKANPALVQYEYAKRWSGQMPHMVPSSNTPMLLQVPAAR